MSEPARAKQAPPQFAQRIAPQKPNPMREAHQLQRAPPGSFRKPTRYQDPDEEPGGVRCSAMSLRLFAMEGLGVLCVSIPR
jgi:hypothetical protein